jgi:hypothetical protein
MKPATVVQISRGVCPARSIAEACCRARELGWGYSLITGMAAADAKEAAAKVADRDGTGLLLIEDDIVASAEVWKQVAASTAPVAFAPTVMHNHRWNVKSRSDGSVLYSGTVFVRLTRGTLDALERPLFAHGSFGIEDDRLWNRGPGMKGRGSDVHMWWRIQEAGITDVEELPEVEHLSHPHNGPKGGYALDRPMTVKPYTLNGDRRR